MSVEEVADSGISSFRGFGYPREAPNYEVSVDPTMQRMLSEINADMEAKRVRAEAELLTPEGRRINAEAKLAEKRRKENHWLSRVIHERGNGWKSIWGTAEDEELRIYTLVDSGEHRFWGVKPIGMGIDQFWEKYDPEVRRYDDRQQETPLNPDAPVGPLIGEPSRIITPNKATVRPKKQQKAAEINSSHRVRKSTTESPKANKKARKSFASRVDSGHLEPKDQMRERRTTPDANDRRTRTSTIDTAPSAHPELPKRSAPLKHSQRRPATKAKVAANEDTLPVKRPRGRPPAKRKSAERTSNQKKSPVVKGNARVIKSSQKESRTSAPSTHKMRTRRAGPGENLQLP